MSFCGADDIGDKVKQLVEKQGVELVNFITDRTIHTTYSFILRYKGDRTILVYRDKFDYKKLNIDKIKKTKWLYLSSLGEGYEKDAIKLISEKNIRLAMNPGKHQLEAKKRDFLLLVKMAEIVIVNKEEAEILANVRFPLQMKELYYRLSEFGIKNLIITDAKNGAYTRVGRDIIHQKAIIAKTVEQTGAGDAFGAGFLARYMKDGDIVEALKWGVVNGAKVTEEIGAQNGILDRRQMEKIVSSI
jgi:sugar/nucleoside kinase (ribokinase family)